MTVRLPSAARYAPQVEKEHRWLLKLAPLLPLPIPVPLAKGVPGEGYPDPWSVYRWIEGEPATVGRIADLVEFATALADFLTALQRIDPAGGPPGRHNFFRGGPLTVYDAETRQAIAALNGRIDADAATAAWEAALAATWHGAPVWFPAATSPLGTCWSRGPAERCHRLRDLGRGRPLVRSGDRVDPLQGRKP